MSKATKTTNLTSEKTKSETSWEFLEKPLTTDDILSAGEELGRVLGSTSFNLVWRTLLRSYQNEIIESEDHETKRREMLRLKCQILSDLAHEMAGLVRQAQGIAADKLLEEESNQREIDAGMGFQELH